MSKKTLCFLLSFTVISPALADSFSEQIGQCDDLFTANQIKQANRSCMAALHEASNNKEYIQIYSRLAVINRSAGNNKTAIDLANGLLEIDPQNIWARQFISENQSLTENHSKLDIVMIKNEKLSAKEGSAVFDTYDVVDASDVASEPTPSAPEVDTSTEGKMTPQEEADDKAGKVIALGIGALLLYGAGKAIKKTFEPVEPSSDGNSSPVEPSSDGNSSDGNFGALAIDHNQGSAYGFSHNYSSQSEAEDRALKECNSRGGSSCDVKLTYSSGCAAYAAAQDGGDGYGWGHTSSESSAKSDALSNCSAQGSSCVVRAWSCN